jgi:hypothetical protein
MFYFLIIILRVYIEKSVNYITWIHYKRILFSHELPDWLWGPPDFPRIGTESAFLRDKAVGRGQSWTVTCVDFKNEWIYPSLLDIHMHSFTNSF